MKVLTLGLAISLIVGLAGLTEAKEQYPSREIELMIPWGVGGADSRICCDVRSQQVV